MKEEEPEPTYFRLEVLKQGPEELKRFVLVRERFELGLTRNLLVAQLKGVNSRLHELNGLLGEKPEIVKPK